MTDSYKTTHVYLYPEAQRMAAYGEFRRGFNSDLVDQRIVFYGIRYLIDQYISIPLTESDVEQAADFFATHNVGSKSFPFPKDLFLKFVRENSGFWPVEIKALKEGSVIYPHVPVYTITAEGEYARLVTYLETILTMVWYPTTVATLSRRCYTILERTFNETVDESQMWALESRLHDFGFRGCTSLEQSIIGGAAHLLTFSGTDTLSAAWFVQYKLNNGKAIASSIPATEHSIMTAYRTEKEAIERLLNQFGEGVCACVMDSYDYTHMLEEILPSIAKIKVEKGGFLVLRPDSGNPVEVVLQALRASDEIFGSDINSKGFKVLRGVGVIQGDGINISTLEDISVAVKQAGFAANNVAYGMGGGLLQKVNRDTMSFATKLSKIVYKDGTDRNVMKMPIDDPSKRSLPGEFQVLREPLPTVYPIEAEKSGNNELEVVYNHGKVISWDTFEDVRERLAKQWKESPLKHDPISALLRAKIDLTIASQQVLNS